MYDAEFAVSLNKKKIIFTHLKYKKTYWDTNKQKHPHNSSLGVNESIWWQCSGLKKLLWFKSIIFWIKKNPVEIKTHTIHLAIFFLVFFFTDEPQPIRLPKEAYQFCTKNIFSWSFYSFIQRAYSLRKRKYHYNIMIQLLSTAVVHALPSTQTYTIITIEKKYDRNYVFH